MRKIPPTLGLAILFRFYFSALLALAPAAAFTPLQAAQDEPTATDAEGKVRCPDCNEDGKMPCPTCAGKGELMKTCELCSGSGQKPCPVCAGTEAKATPNVTPGRVACDYCGGKGNLAEGKLCPRCEGLQTLGCTSCGSKGKLPCRKQVTDKVCPSCRFASKVACTTCAGSLRVSPRLIPERRAGSARAAANTPLPGEELRSSPASELDTPVEAAPSAVEIDARFAALKAIHDSHMDIFAVNPRTGVESLRNQALKLIKSLPRATRKDGSVAGDLLAFVERTQQFRVRWSTLREAFNNEHKTFLPAQKLLGAMAERLNEVPKSRRAELEAELLTQAGVALRVAEKRARKLEDESPAWLAEEMAGIETEWKSLEPRATSELKLLATQAREARDVAEKAALEKKAAREASSKAAAERAAQLRRDRLAQRKAGGEARSAAAVRAEIHATQARGDPENEEDGNQVAARPGRKPAVKLAPAQGNDQRLLWLVAFLGLVGGAVAWVIARQRKPAVDDGAPPAVS